MKEKFSCRGVDPKNVFLCDFPECIKWDFKFDKMPHGLIYFVRVARNTISLTSNEYVENKFKSGKCRDCNVYCKGLSPLYENIYGNSEVKPLVSNDHSLNCFLY